MGALGRVLGAGWEGIKAAPMKAVSDVTQTAKDAYSGFTDPKLSTVLPMVAPGATALMRVGAFGAGKMLDEPSTDPMQNLGTAAKGAAIPAALEAAVPFLGKVVRSLPGMKGRIAGQDAARYGETMEKLSPPLAGARTADDLRSLAAGPGQAQLGAAKGAANQDISTSIGARNALDLPSTGQTGLTLQQANDTLSEISARAFSKNPLDR